MLRIWGNQLHGSFEWFAMGWLDSLRNIVRKIPSNFTQLFECVAWLKVRINWGRIIFLIVFLKQLLSRDIFSIKALLKSKNYNLFNQPIKVMPNFDISFFQFTFKHLFNFRCKPQVLLFFVIINWHWHFWQTFSDQDAWEELYKELLVWVFFFDCIEVVFVLLLGVLGYGDGNHVSKLAWDVRIV